MNFSTELSMEDQFNLTVLIKEIDNCTDLDQLKDITKSLLRMHMSHRALSKNMLMDALDFKGGMNG